MTGTLTCVPHAMRTRLVVGSFAETGTCKRIFARERGFLSSSSLDTCPGCANTTYTKRRCKVFPAELRARRPTNCRFFLPRFCFCSLLLVASPSSPFGPPHRSARGKALLMRSLIRPIEGCFADRSDVYPSRSATTRCASSPQHGAKRT